VKSWVVENLLQKFSLAKKQTSRVEVQLQVSVTFVVKCDLLLVADSRLHFFHLGPNLEHQTVRQAPAVRAKSALEEVLESGLQTTTESVQKRITVMMNTTTQMEAAHAAEGAALAPARQRGGAFVKPKRK
jgi:hypothetical protein